MSEPSEAPDDVEPLDQALRMYGTDWIGVALDWLGQPHETYARRSGVSLERVRGNAYAQLANFRAGFAASAEEARASERERYAKICDAVANEHIRSGCYPMEMSGLAVECACRIRAAPPSPEPERRDPLEELTGQKKVSWPVKSELEPEPEIVDYRDLLERISKTDPAPAWVPPESRLIPPLAARSEPEALTERIREIVLAELNARPFMEYARTLRPLAERVDRLEGFIVAMAKALCVPSTQEPYRP